MLFFIQWLYLYNKTVILCLYFPSIKLFNFFMNPQVALWGLSPTPGALLVVSFTNLKYSNELRYTVWVGVFTVLGATLAYTYLVKTNLKVNTRN
jgi:H+/gluconate symporter-like permease